MSATVAVFLLVFVSSAFGYLIGSVMTSDIVGFAIKKSARLHWSKNPGTTNSIRVYGSKNGVIVGIGDIAKSFVAFLVSWFVLRYGLRQHIETQPGLYDKVYYLVYLANLFAIVGHCWPVYFKFKGGKAAAPTVGFLVSLSFWWLIVIAIVWVIVLIRSKYVSLATLVCATLLPVINLINYLDYLNFFSIGQPFWVPADAATGVGGYLTYQSDWHVILYLEINNVIVAAIIFWKHRSNIARLRNRNENKIGQAKRQHG